MKFFEKMIEHKITSLDMALDDLSPARHWAFIKRELEIAREKALKAHGLNERTFHELEYQAIAEISGDFIDTEYGRINKRYLYADPTDPEHSARVVDGLVLSHKQKEK